VGARVIKVEHAGHGDETRAFPPFFERSSVYFASVNPGEESIALDFNRPEDREVLLEMIRRADVVVEIPRFVTLEHLGLDYDHLRRINRVSSTQRSLASARPGRFVSARPTIRSFGRWVA
jgi:CoA:oxalate CoA-transferase